MKKLFLLCLIFSCLTAGANEIVEDYIDIATNYCTHGNYKEAMSYLDKALQIQPANIEVNELKATLSRVMAINSKSYLTSTDKNIDLAFSYKKVGNKDKQIAELSKIPNNFWTNYLLAEHYRDMRDFQKAQYYYEQAKTLKPNYSQCYLGLAKVYIEKKEYQNAIDNLDKYLSYNKNADIAYALKAEANMNLNNLAEAQKNIKKALNVDENISYLLIEAKILYHQGYYDDAREKLQILSRNVQTSEVYKYIGLCDYAQNDYANALLNLNKAIILSEDDKNLISTYNNVKAILSKEYEKGNSTYKN